MTDDEQPAAAADVPFDGTLPSVLALLNSVLEENPRSSGKQLLAALQEATDALPEATVEENPGEDPFEGLIVADDGSELTWQGNDYVRVDIAANTVQAGQGHAGKSSVLAAADFLDEKPRSTLTRGRAAHLLRQWAEEQG